MKELKFDSDNDYELYRLNGFINYYKYFKGLVDDSIKDINDIAMNSVSDEAKLKATEFLLSTMIGNFADEIEDDKKKYFDNLKDININLNVTTLNNKYDIDNIMDAITNRMNEYSHARNEL
jgi:hypothetical protein